MSISPELLQKINYFNKLSLDMCKTIAEKVENKSCKPNTQLLKEGGTGDTMILIFQGQVEVTKSIMVKAADGFTTSRKPIIRLETTEPPPKKAPVINSTVDLAKNKKIKVNPKFVNGLLRNILRNKNNLMLI